MNDQSNPSQFKNFGAAPTPPSAVSRLLPHMRTLAAGSAIASLFALGAQKLLPDGWRPSDILGSAAGLSIVHETEEVASIKLDYERRLADAKAQAQIKAQEDIAAVNKALEARTQSLEGETNFAILADALCLGGQIVAGLGSQNTGADWHNGARTVSDATCGLGDEVRKDITQSQLDAVRTASVTRGQSMTDGAIRPRAVAEPGTPEARERVYAISHPSQHYTWDAVQKVRGYVAVNLAMEAQQRLMEHLPSDNSGWDVYVDRVRAYVDLFGQE